MPAITHPSLAFGVIALIATAAPTGTVAAQRGQGRVTCRVQENGDAASGTMSVRSGGREVASGSCGSPLAVDPGSYQVVVRLDGALDQPEQTRSARVRAGATETVTVDFPTGTLTVKVEAGGRRAAAMATIYQGGKRIGTLGSGVAGHLSAGTYDVVVRYRTAEKRFENVTVSRGRDRTLQANF